ncbi:putative mannose-6-phosphate isomerase ManA [Actinoplanes ianthinogenes]|uniref:mannose-6-phosphate isomerase n=1 Tax=Actinoplanes ianthinogenes TaxID=122358 RepID=A0ABN6CGA3_9ACTN|nr:mannose-6-phosphate isomerase, class I [Actinoplanes ianthinogenes]BCJ44581.1 putative mannose-6-phosphate isomerase ManA [Actinoplanes ianthinogenes]GGQ98869.1 putative mannose-6-phosphate isomerase ManA [Actinoplanes ianthinogenes]
MTVYPLTGVIRPYAWGSRTAIAELQGRPTPTEGPEAELWLGAHPGDPSTVPGPDGPVTLLQLIDDDPGGQLGTDVAERFGARLPYLMKVLAAGAPLSLQAHPDLKYAAEAFARQEADPALSKNYTDANHKPEMLVALTPFDALCGFRSPAVSALVLTELGVARLGPVVAALHAGDLSEAVRLLLSWPAEDRPALIDEVVAAATAAEPGHPHEESFRLAIDLAGHYPGDPGVLVALLLNLVHLTPGEAIWMPAGNLHAYLHGLGVELMAASDNVLRGGLTPKRVDVAELLRVLRFETLDDPLLHGAEVAPGVTSWRVPVRDFEMFRIELTGDRPPVKLPGRGPRIILGVAGDVHVGEEHGIPVTLPPGTAAYAPASAGPLTAAGLGTVFVAAVPG